MSSMKSLFVKYLKSCHVSELIENNFKFPEEEGKSNKTAIENSMPPVIPTRPKVDEITSLVVKN